jgi:hypothetical protein
MEIDEGLAIRLRAGKKDAFETFAGLIVEEALKLLPHVVERLAKQSMALHKLSAKFYADNPDLVEHKETVTRTLERLEADNPGKDPRQLIDRCAPMVRDILRNKRISTDSGQGMKSLGLASLDAKMGEL